MASASPTTGLVPGPDAPPFPPGGATAFPPGGATASYDYAPAIIATSCVFLALSTIALGLRLFCKWLKSGRLWWDDFVLVGSWVSEERYRLMDVADFAFLDGLCR